MSGVSKKRAKKESDFVCKIKYRSTLPQLPFDAKTIRYDVDLSQYVPYSHTSLMKNHVWEYYPETSFPLDLVDMEAWNPDPAMKLDAEDSVLLKEELGDSRTLSNTTKPSVSWLRRTEYISGEYSKIMGSKGSTEIKTIGLDATSRRDTYKTREDHVRAIEESFEAVKKIYEHPTKPNITVMDIVPVLPDTYLWMNQYTLCTFDDDPATAKENSTASSANRALMKPMKNPDDPDDRFVLYFVPNESLKKKQTSYLSDSDQNLDVYECTREYAMELKVEPKGQQYFFVQRKDGIYYNELNSKLVLHKRRAKGKYPRETIYERPSLLLVKPRELTSEETDIQNERLKDLL